MIKRSIIVAGLLIAGALYLNSAARLEPVPIRQSLSGLSTQIGKWNSAGASEYDNKTLKILGVDDYINRIYCDSENSIISLYIGYYRNQRQGNTIHSPMNCLPGAGWNAIENDILNMTVCDNNNYQNQNIKIKKLVIRKGADQQMVLYWYQSHGRIEANEYWDKIYTVLDAIRTNRTDAALIRVISPIIGAEETAKAKAENRASDFVRALFPVLDKYIPY